ncbi:MAG: DUF3040 domain-containing protein [Lacisediminihabitans sp.]
MPLSEQEQRLLEEMERSLYHNDADFVATVNHRTGKPNYTTIVVGILVGLLGVAAIVTGVVIHQPLVGVAGFIVMFVGALLAISPPRRGSDGPEDAVPPARGNAAKPDFMDRLNERWEKRQDGHGE